MKGFRKNLLLCILLLLTVACMVIAACGGNTVKLTFHTNGGEEMQAVTVAKGEEYTLEEPKWEGHSFEGWYLDSALTDGPVETFVAEKDQDFYAKWEEMYRITLVLNGGTLAGVSGSETTVWLKAGTNISTFLQSYVPQKAGGQFAAWYNGETELDANALMGTEALTLTAHYKVQYTVTLYLQSLEDLTVYEKAEEDYIDYEYAGKNFLPAPEVTGFTQIVHESGSTAKVLSEDYTQNTYTLYFDRNEATVVFIANTPDGTEFENVRVSTLYGAEVELPGDLFEVEGYLLVGWSTMFDGTDPIYNNYIQSHAFNAPSNIEIPTIVAEDVTILFGVWVQGCADLFGGNDFIYHFSEDATDIYLCRAGQYFSGTYTPRTSTFRFVNGDNRSVLQGKLIGGGAFVYFNESIDGVSRKLYVFGEGVDESTTIYFDAYNGIIYSSAKRDSEGTYYIDDYGYYVATFTTGDMAGKTITFMTGTSRGYDVFAIRNDEEFNWGVMHRAAVNGSSLTYYTQAYLLQLNGFGTAAITTNGSTTTYSYTRDGDEITLINSNNKVYAIARHFTLNGIELYVIYSADYDRTFKSTDGSTLTLDGTYNAKYSVGNVNGYYTLYSSVFGTLAKIVTSQETYLFLLKTESRTEYDENGHATTVYDYTFERKPTSYAEYYYCDTTFSSAMLVVLNEKEEGKVTVYGRNGNKEYEKVLLGSYTYDEGTRLYSVTVDIHYEYSESVNALYDYSQIEAFTFGTDIYVSSSIFGTSAYPVTYWHSVTMKDDEPSDLETVYNEAKGTGKLTVVGAFATLEWEGRVFTGQYSVSENLMLITPYGSSSSVYIEINEAEHTFVVLADLFGTAYRLNPVNGARVPTETLVFDGKGGAVYSFNTTEGDATVTKKYEGKIERTSETSLGGSAIYVFTSLNDDYTFRFIILSSSSYSYFAREDAVYGGTYEAKNEDELALDGFGFFAKYSTRDGAVLEGQYLMPDENTVYFIYRGTYGFYFDLDVQGKTFTTRGSEYGEDYLLIDNNGSRGIYFAFDGHGHLVVYSYEKDETEESGYKKIVHDDDAGYEIKNGKFYLEYRIGVDHYTIEGLLGTLTQGGYTYNVFIREHEEVVSVYINASDWTVLELDAYGNVTKHNGRGKRESGMYLLITDDLLYYVNSKGSDACLYRYDRVKGTVTEIRYRARGYFTEELDALLFSEAGFMIEGGETRYYYEVDANGDVTLWHQDWENDDRNQYGFVQSKDFGKFEDTKVIDGKTYYVNTGYAIVFKRDEDNAAKYPVTIGSRYVLDEEGNRIKDENGQYVTEPVKANLDQLSFTPSGAAEFAVRGSVVINDSNVDCTVYRTYNEETQKYEMFLTISSGASLFVFDINVFYTGDSASETSHNVYEITAMETEINLYSSTYLYYFYMYYMMMGVQLKNSFGFISIVNEYDTAGDVTEKYVQGTFGVSSGMFDTNGKLIQLDHAQYDYENSTYTVEIENDDEYTYYLRFKASSNFHAMFGVYSYDLVAFTRVEKFETDNGYTLEVERVIASDNYSVGQYWDIKLKYEDKELEPTTVYIYKNTLYFFIRSTDDDGKSTGAEYYIITFTLDEEPAVGGGGLEDGDVEGGDPAEGEADGPDPDLDDGEGEEEDTTNRNPLPVFKDVTVRHISADTYYTADGANYVDVSEDKQEVLMVVIGSTVHLIEKTEYDEETGTYTLTTLSGKVFSVTITEDVAEIVEVKTETQN